MTEREKVIEEVRSWMRANDIEVPDMTVDLADLLLIIWSSGADGAAAAMQSGPRD